MVAIWGPTFSGNVGHMYTGSMDGTKTYTSQFPRKYEQSNKSMQNMTYGRKATALAEGGLPASLFAVTVPDIDEFLKEAQRHRDMENWGKFSMWDKQSTSCTEAGVGALGQGGFPWYSFGDGIQPFATPQIMPEVVRQELLLRSLGGAKIRRLDPKMYYGEK